MNSLPSALELTKELMLPSWSESHGPSSSRLCIAVARTDDEELSKEERADSHFAYSPQGLRFLLGLCRAFPLWRALSRLLRGSLWLAEALRIALGLMSHLAALLGGYSLSLCCMPAQSLSISEGKEGQTPSTWDRIPPAGRTHSWDGGSSRSMSRYASSHRPWSMQACSTPTIRRARCSFAPSESPWTRASQM